MTYCLNANTLPEDKRAFGLLKLYSIYYEMLSSEEKELYNKVELPLVRVLFDMERQGVCINIAALDELSQRYAAELKELTQRIYELAGETFNVNSTQQLGKILFDKLKIAESVKKTKETKSYKDTGAG